MNPYAGRYAELYDLFYSAKPYEEEAHFVHQCLCDHSSTAATHLLELACGTGKHAVHFAKLGYEVTATDYSTDMLQVARRSAQQNGLMIEFRQQDMRRLPVPRDPYDAVVCLFDSLGYVQTDEALRDVFRGVHDGLREDGLFIFEFWHAPAMIGKYDPVRVRRFSVTDGMILRTSETELLHDVSLARVTYNVYHLRNDKTYDHLVETHTNRFFSVAEMDALAGKSGFLPLISYDGFRSSTDITDDTWHVIAVWRKVHST